MTDGELFIRLNAQYEDANAEVKDAWAVVQRKFGAIANGQSRDNPTYEELTRLENAKVKRDEIDLQIRDFMKSRFGVNS